MENPIFDNDFFQKLNTLTLGMKLRLQKGMGGARKSTAKGSSVEFSDFREYMLGDDLRRIDWNAYGRMNKLYIKQYMEEKEGLFHIFVDTSKSMCYGEKPKSLMALQIAGALSYVILNNLDRVFVDQIKDGILISGTGRCGRNSFRKILSELSAMEFEGRTDLKSSICKKQFSGAGASILISDFLDEQGMIDVISYLRYKKQEIVLIEISAREEIEVTAEGTVNIVDMETDEKLKVTVTKDVLKQYQIRKQEHSQNLRRLCEKYGMVYLEAVSDEPIDQVLFNEFSKHNFLQSRG